MNKKLLLLLLLLQITTIENKAEVKLPSILSNNMVLQQQTDIVLWGESNKKSSVKITPSWSDKSYNAKINNGKWEVEIPTPKAGGPYNITFNDGDQTILSNILVGEVWFCSGQSNMAMPLRGNQNQPVLGSQDIIIKAKESTPIRLFNVGYNPQFTPQNDCEGTWKENTPESAALFSAVAYIFGKELSEALDIPVGLINSSIGGSKIEAWMSEDMLKLFPNIDLSPLKGTEYPKYPHRSVAFLYNGMVHPLLKYRFKGMLWYQGCSNVSNYVEYKELMPAFIETLRKEFDCGNFPLYFAQLAPLSYGKMPNGNVLMREAQVEIKNKLENSQIVIQTDIGEPLCIHPRYKITTGKRFAYLALGDTYKMKGFTYLSPEYEAMKIEKANFRTKNCKSIHLKFKYAPSGVYLDNFVGENFEIAGADKIFYPAQVTLLKSEYPIAVYSDKVKEPVAVRYGFKEYVKGELYGHSNLPVSSFRTDNWVVPTK